MAPSSLALPILAWLATYAVHSTVLLALAWLVTRRSSAERVKQLVWRAALLGGIVTASTQALGALGPARGADFDLTEWAPAAITERTDESARPLATDEPRTLELMPLAAAEPSDPAPLSTLGRLSTLSTDGGWPLVALAGWLAGGLTIVGLFMLGRRRLDRELVGARMLDSGPLPELLADLRERAGVRRAVRLCVAPRLKGPIATGVLRPRIWLPPRALTELDAQLQESMLGHELAHVARLDPLWLGLCRALETLFFFQPLNRIARRRLSECAEYLCDEEAVRYTGDRVSLARCLAEVATWFVGRAAPVPACGMADKRSPLGMRVERILDRERRDRRPHTVLPLLAVALGSTVLYAPAFSAEASSAVLPANSIEPDPESVSATLPATPLELVLRELDQLEEMRLDLNRDIADLHVRSAGRHLSEDQHERLQSLQLHADRVNTRVDLVRGLIERVRRIQETKAAR